VNFLLPVTIRLNPDVVLPNVLCGALGKTAGCAGPVTLPQLGGLKNSDDSAILDLGQSLGGQKFLKIGGQVEAYVEFRSPLDGGDLGDVEIIFKDSVASPTLEANPISILTNPDVTTKTVALGGCTDRDNNATSVYRGGQFGAVPGPLNFGSGTLTPGPNAAAKVANDADNPNNMPYMNTPLVGPDGNPNVRENTVLRVGGPVTPQNPNGNLGVGINGTRSGGTANVLGAGPSQVKLALSIRTYSIYRYNVDAARGNGVYNDNGAFNFFDVYDYNCRQSWTGYIQNELNAVVGGDKKSLRIAPAFTLDRHLRIAKINFGSTGVTTHNQVAACLQPYTTFVNYGTQAQSFNWDHFTTGDISDDFPLPIFAQITDELDQDRSAIGPAPGTISGIPLGDDSFNAGIAQCDEYPYVNGVYPDVTGNLGEPWNTTGAGETPLTFLGPAPLEPDYAQPPYLLHRMQCGEIVPGGACEQSSNPNDVANKARLDADLTVQNLTGEVLIGHGIPAGPAS
jgi:hypothetical protein